MAHPAERLARFVEAGALGPGGLVHVLHRLRAPPTQAGRGVRAVSAVLVDLARVVDGRGRRDLQCTVWRMGHGRGEIAPGKMMATTRHLEHSETLSRHGVSDRGVRVCVR